MDDLEEMRLWMGELYELQEDKMTELRGKIETEPKPDEGRLIDEHMMLLQTQNGGKVIVDTTPALKAQLAKDLEWEAIKDAECLQTLKDMIAVDDEACQARVEGIFKEIETRLAPHYHQNPQTGIYEHDGDWFLANEVWQALKDELLA